MKGHLRGGLRGKYWVKGDIKMERKRGGKGFQLLSVRRLI